MIAAYRALLRAHIGVGLAYRARLTIWILSSLFPLLLMAVWLAVVDEVGPAAGWGRTDFVSYYAAAALLYHTTQSFLVWTWDDDLRSGNLSYKLLKPIDPFHQYLTQEIGFRAVVVAVLVPILVILTVVIPDLTYRISPFEWALVVVAAASGFFLNVMMSLAFCTIGFRTTQAANVYSLWWGAGAFLSGWIAPLALMPAPVAAAGQLLPFRSSMGFPLEILLDRLRPVEIAFGFTITLAWIVVFALLYRLGWRSGIKRFQAVGG
jgi:ABC-2 type transport system permease protein